MVFKNGNVPWNKNKKGVTEAWNKGKKCPQISKALMGIKRPDLVIRNKKNRKEKIILKCLCGKEFFVNPSRKDTSKYCSQECYNKFTSHTRAKGKHWKLSKETRKKQGLHQVGEKNHQWNGGYFRGKYIGIPQSKEFARRIFKRDKYACQICGDIGRKAKLNAHHLNSVDKYPKQAGDINNGITLCEKHHQEFHKKYGYGKNIKKQFEEFITEEICDIKTILMNKSTIYNLTLEGEDTFYANGILTHNTPPHIIKAKPGKVLHWHKTKGRTQHNHPHSKEMAKDAFFAKEVHHPGSRPNPFIRNTIKNQLQKIIIEEISR